MDADRITKLEQELEKLLELRDWLTQRINSQRHQIKYLKAEREKLVPKGGQFYRTADVSDLIRDYMYKYRLSYSELARMANVSDTTVQHIVNKKFECTREQTIEALLIAMEMPHVLADLELVHREYRATPPQERANDGVAQDAE